MIVLDRKSERNLVTKRYNFHGIFRLALHSNEPDAIRDFQAEYGAFEDVSDGPVDLEVTVARFSVGATAGVQRFGRYSMADGWIFGAERYKVASWQFALRGLA